MFDDDQTQPAETAPSPVEPFATTAPPPPPASDEGDDFQIRVLARSKRGGRWLLAEPEFSTRLEAERHVRELREAFPTVDLRVVVVGFPAEQQGELPQEAVPGRLGDSINELMSSLRALAGLLDDEAGQVSTRAALADRRRRVLGIDVVRRSGER